MYDAGYAIDEGSAELCTRWGDVGAPIPPQRPCIHNSGTRLDSESEMVLPNSREAFRSCVSPCTGVTAHGSAGRLCRLAVEADWRERRMMIPPQLLVVHSTVPPHIGVIHRFVPISRGVFCVGRWGNSVGGVVEVIR